MYYVYTILSRGPWESTQWFYHEIGPDSKYVLVSIHDILCSVWFYLININKYNIGTYCG